VRAEELQLSSAYTALFVCVLRILPTKFVSGRDTDFLPHKVSLTNDVDPVVMTGTLNAPTNTGTTSTARESPPKEPPPKDAGNEQRPPVPPSAHQTGTVHTERKVYRPKLPSLYVEPDLGADLLDGMKLIHKECGRSIRQAVDPFPVRTDSIKFDPSVHQK
jgi:hypothetical protein